ncbi:MAG: prepilin-type N-terminal cleavage/methylation domain-containing protein [Gemmatimonadaceae bacterium]|nr:prepilin-type N-terminal cleavage/methylation domain-containing protein [Gemmatimonadaceae bacterium]
MRRGVTLLELLIVLTILGVVAGVTVPAMVRTVDDDDLSKATREVVTLLTRTRATAIERAERVTLTLDPRTRRYWVYADSARTGTGITSGALSIPLGVELLVTGERVHFAFVLTGVGSGDPLALELGARANVITVEQWTGEVHVVAR